MQEEKTSNGLSILEYSQEMGISLSTIRRRIKAGKLQYILKNGKYFILGDFKPREKKEELLKEAKEQIAELQTLIAFYEEKIDL